VTIPKVAMPETTGVVIADRHFRCQHRRVRLPPLCLFLFACAPHQLAVTSPVELVEPASSPYHEVRLAMSPDGDTMMWGSKDRPGGPGSSDLWLSRRSASGWSAPEPVSFNCPEKDYDPAYSPDGRYVYFFSDRPGGLGGDDLYRVPVTGSDFGAVEHLDAAVNSAGNDWGPLPLADGSLMFATDGRGGRRHDLYLAAPTPTGFAPATPLAGAVNTDGDEIDPAVLANGDLVYAHSRNIENDAVLLMHARPEGRGYSAGTPLPLSINVANDATYGAAIDFRDPTLLYFSGTRPGLTRGKRDIYRVHVR
jgi:TolB protein